MPTPSPLCTVKDGASAPVSTPPAAAVTPGNTVTIALASSGADTWAIECIGGDETTDPTAIALTVNAAAKTATFVAPAIGKALRFRSTVNGARDINGQNRADWISTFKVYTPLAGGYAVGVVDETVEHHPLYGSVGILNALVRGAADFISGLIKATKVQWAPASTTAYPINSELDAVQTTDASATVIATYAHADARGVDYTAIVTGYRPATGDFYRLELASTYVRFGGAAPALVGAAIATNERKTGGTTGWTAAINTSGNNVRVVVTGAAAQTINWSVELRAQERA